MRVRAMKKLPPTVETDEDIELKKLIVFFGVGVFRNPETQEVMVIDFRDEMIADA